MGAAATAGLATTLATRARAAARRLRESRREQRRARRVARIAATLPGPAVTEERTWLGPMMDALVTRAKRQQLPLGVDPDYDLVRQHFDHAHYLLQAKVLHERPEVDPIAFFMGNGAMAINSPDPDFSMTNYLERYPERAVGERTPYLHWLKRGRAAGELADPAAGIEQMAPVLGLSTEELVRELVDTRAEVTQRLRHGTLGEMFAKAAEVEPLIAAAWNETARMRILPLGHRFVTDQVAAVHSLQRDAGFRRARLVIVTNRPRWGGGRRLEGHLAHALARSIPAEDVVVVYTDESGTSPRGRFPRGVRELDFFAVTGAMAAEHRERALVALLRSFRADAIVNINSHLFYSALRSYGRALAVSERLFLTFFCNELRAQGNWEGWSQSWFYEGFDLVEGFLTDSQSLRDELAERYQLADQHTARIHVLRAPVEPELPVARTPLAAQGRRPVVAWAGRWDRQKRVDLALQVARMMPEVDFRLWGEPVLHGDPVGEVPTNVTLLGPYAHISDLDLSSVDAWLYTSAWDGVPSLLLEVAMTEVPVVATCVGGVGEILSTTEAWLVDATDGPERYAAALRELLADPEDARRRAHALRERLVRDRSQEAFAADAAALLLTASPRDAEEDR